MTGKIALIVSIVALLGVGYLAINKSSNTVTNDEVQQTTSTSEVETSNSSLRIAYIYGDSLNNQADYITEEQDQLIEAQRNAEFRIQKKMEAAQKESEELINYANSGSATQQDMATAQARLSELQMEMENYQNQETQKLLEKQNKFQEKLTTKLDGFINSYVTENNIDYFFNRGTGLSFLYGSESTNVTHDFITKFNISYQAEKDSLNAKK